jgi:O-antigen polymerase
MLWLVDRYTLTDNTESNFIVCPQTFLIRFFALLIPSIFIPFLLTSLHTAHILVSYEKNTDNLQSLERLNDIINPIAWQNRLDAAVYSHILVSGLREKNVHKLELYLHWVLKRIKHKPRAILYSNALVVLKILNRSKQYQLLLKEAKRTYPRKTEWQDNALGLSKSNSTHQ